MFGKYGPQRRRGRKARGTAAAAAPAAATAGQNTALGAEARDQQPSEEGPQSDPVAKQLEELQEEQEEEVLEAGRRRAQDLRTDHGARTRGLVWKEIRDDAALYAEHRRIARAESLVWTAREWRSTVSALFGAWVTVWESNLCPPPPRKCWWWEEEEEAVEEEEVVTPQHLQPVVVILSDDEAGVEQGAESAQNPPPSARPKCHPRHGRALPPCPALTAWLRPTDASLDLEALYDRAWSPAEEQNQMEQEQESEPEQTPQPKRQPRRSEQEQEQEQEQKKEQAQEQISTPRRSPRQSPLLSTPLKPAPVRRREEVPEQQDEMVERENNLLFAKAGAEGAPYRANPIPAGALPPRPQRKGRRRRSLAGPICGSGSGGGPGGKFWARASSSEEDSAGEEAASTAPSSPRPPLRRAIPGRKSSGSSSSDCPPALCTSSSSSGEEEEAETASDTASDTSRESEKDLLYLARLSRLRIEARRI